MKKKFVTITMLLSVMTVAFCACGETKTLDDTSVSVSEIDIDTQGSLEVTSKDDKKEGSSVSEESSSDSSKISASASLSNSAPDAASKTASVSDNTSSANSLSSESTDASLSASGNEDKKDEVEEPADYLKLYDKILDRVFEILSEEEYWDKVVEGEIGIVEAKTYAKSPMKDIGFCLEDLNKDNVPELLITVKKDMIDSVLAAYTLNNGSPQLIFEGLARSSYKYAGNGVFVYSGSAGAAYSIFGDYKISDDGRKLQSIDYYFSDIDEDYNMYFYHNNTGVWDAVKSDRIIVDFNEFEEMEKEYLSRALSLETTPMSVYASEMKSEKANSQVIIAWAKDVLSDASVFEDVIIDRDEYSNKIAFSTKSAVKDFKIIKLTMKETEDGDNVTFDFEPVYSQDELNKEKLVVATLSLPGDSPSYGFSYVDSDGKERRFAISESGRDGSLEIYEFTTESEEKEN